MNSAEPIIYVVDDDPDVRSHLRGLLSGFGIKSVEFSSGLEFLSCTKTQGPACLIADLHLTDIDGLELQRRILETQPAAVVFVTDKPDVAACVRAIKAGAVDVLVKPCTGSELQATISAAIAQDCADCQERAEVAGLRRRLELLTRREREVLTLVVGGRLNKQGAAELGITEPTFKVHRCRVMQKMQAVTVAELVRMASKLSLRLPAKWRNDASAREAAASSSLPQSAWGRKSGAARRWD